MFVAHDPPEQTGARTPHRVATSAGLRWAVFLDLVAAAMSQTYDGFRSVDDPGRTFIAAMIRWAVPAAVAGVMIAALRWRRYPSKLRH